MKMNTSIKVGDEKYHLRRLHSKLGEAITWEVLSEDKQARLGIIARYNSQWLENRYGWRRFKVKYWLFHRFWQPRVISGDTMKEVISKRKM